MSTGNSNTSSAWMQWGAGLVVAGVGYLYHVKVGRPKAIEAEKRRQQRAEEEKEKRRLRQEQHEREEEEERQREEQERLDRLLQQHAEDRLFIEEDETRDRTKVIESREADGWHYLMQRLSRDYERAVHYDEMHQKEWEGEHFTVWWEESPLFTTIKCDDDAPQRVPKENVRHLSHLNDFDSRTRYVVDDCENPQFLFDVEKQIYIKLSEFPKVYSDQNLQDFYASLANFLQQPNAGLRRARGPSSSSSIPKTSEDEIGVEYDPNFNMHQVDFDKIKTKSCYDPFTREWKTHQEASKDATSRQCRVYSFLGCIDTVAEDWALHVSTICAKNHVNDENLTIFCGTQIKYSPSQDVSYVPDWRTYWFRCFVPYRGLEDEAGGNEEDEEEEGRKDKAHFSYDFYKRVSGLCYDPYLERFHTTTTAYQLHKARAACAEVIGPLFEDYDKKYELDPHIATKKKDERDALPVRDFHLLMVGDADVGKTQFIRTLESMCREPVNHCRSSIVESPRSISIDTRSFSSSKKNSCKRDYVVRLHITNIRGGCEDEEDDDFEDYMYRDIRYDGIVFAFDTTVFATKQAIVHKWIPITKHQILEQRESDIDTFDQTAKFALGLKLDLPSKTVSKEMAFDREFESAVGGNGFHAHVRCSSLTGANVIPAMEEIVTALLKCREAQEEKDIAAAAESIRELVAATADVKVDPTPPAESDEEENTSSEDEERPAVQKQSFSTLIEAHERTRRAHFSAGNAIQERKESENATTSTAKPRQLRKVIVLGDAKIGKSVFLSALTRRGEDLPTTYRSTIGADFLVHTCDTDRCTYALQLWDTAGEDRFASLGDAFYRGADAFLLAYNVHDKDTFSHLSAHCAKAQAIEPSAMFFTLGLQADELFDYNDEEDDEVLMASCGTTSDDDSKMNSMLLPPTWEVDEDDLDVFAAVTAGGSLIQKPHFFASSATGKNVDAVVRTLCSRFDSVAGTAVVTVPTSTGSTHGGGRRHRGRTTKTTAWYKKGRAKLSSSDDDE